MQSMTQVPARSAGQPPSSSTPALHQYACLRCRSRRVKCDKILSGCSHCANHAAQCVYSARRPRKSNKASQHLIGQRSLLPASVLISTLVPDDRASEGAVRGSGSGPRGSELSGSEDEDTIILKELRDGLSEASKDMDSEGPVEARDPVMFDADGAKPVGAHFISLILPRMPSSRDHVKHSKDIG